ncbi:MAG: hypothetical protein ICV66_04000 [Chitinophagaceae bacterium]|nr:hypothetical protein [Chitinophagaceae bacterium]
MAAILYKWFTLYSFWFTVGLPAGVQNFRSTNVSVHPFYVSVTEISHNNKDRTLEISCKMFTEDLEQVLSQNYKIKADLSNEKSRTVLSKLIADYITKHLAIAADAKPVSLNFLGFEKEKESVYCYFEAENISAVKKINVSNSILYDFTSDQINIMHVTVSGTRKSYKLDFPNKQASFEF